MVPCGRLAANLRLPWYFVKNLRPPQGRPEATVRYHFKGRTAAAWFSVSTNSKYAVRLPYYVTATVCDRGNAAAAL